MLDLRVDLLGLAGSVIGGQRTEDQGVGDPAEDDRAGGGAGLFSAMRINYYSIGENLDLAALDSRVAALSTAIGAAIP